MNRCLRWIVPALVLAAVGCAGGMNRAEILEARLRDHEDALYKMQAQLAAREAELEIAQQESNRLRTAAAEKLQPAVLPEQAEILTRASGLRFNELLTRPVDRDGSPGDDAVNIVLVPHDADGELVKLPGELHLELVDLSRAEGERTIATWTCGAAESRAYWHSGWLSSGYQFEIPWDEPPAGSQLTVHARLTTPDGRMFPATHTVNLQPNGAPNWAALDAVENGPSPF
ncbi:MAG: hypothetical protein KY476_13325, partial [Planctomycetes bacterium]|nr:hypothetical protein [Planctomycetota bacterium]